MSVLSSASCSLPLPASGPEPRGLSLSSATGGRRCTATRPTALCLPVTEKAWGPHLTTLLGTPGRAHRRTGREGSQGLGEVRSHLPRVTLLVDGRAPDGPWAVSPYPQCSAGLALCLPEGPHRQREAPSRWSLRWCRALVTAWMPGCCPALPLCWLAAGVVRTRTRVSGGSRALPAGVLGRGLGGGGPRLVGAWVHSPLSALFPLSFF